MCARDDQIQLHGLRNEDGINIVQEQRRMSTFMQYAMLASAEALEDAAWHPKTDQQREMTVSQDFSIAR